jgi:sialic acid synthase
MNVLKSKKNAAYVIAEVGQNHQGSFDEAAKYISELANSGVDAVKFQMRDNKSLFTASKLLEKYDSVNSFGTTYGEHREFLELPLDDMFRLRELTYKYDLDFICTPFDEVSLQNVVSMDVDVIKIASFDFGNLPFLEQIIKTNKHFVLSTGGSDYELVDRFVNKLIDKHAKFSLLHCVSNYPCPPEAVNLGRIKYLKENFPNLTIGLSDHFSGILTGPLGLICGAEIFEKHVTFNRSSKGTDHAFSLTIEGMKKFVRDINRVPQMLGDVQPNSIGKEYVFTKLGKSIVARINIEKGEIFRAEMLTGVIHSSGLPVRNSMQLIGRIATKSYIKGDRIHVSELES